MPVNEEEEPMAVRDLIPWGRSRSSVPSMAPSDEVSPFVALHREMNRLFDDVFNRFDTGMPSLLGRTPGFLGGAWPSVEVNASENEVRVSAELPGMDEKDVEVLVDNDVLTIRGENHVEPVLVHVRLHPIGCGLCNGIGRPSSWALRE